MVSGDMISALTHAAESNPSLNNMGTPFLPVWAAEPKEIANAGPFLASDGARMISAEHLSIGCLASII
jgi:hypothetical protein